MRLYKPSPAPTKVEDIPAYLERELQAIAATTEQSQDYDELNTAPVRTKNGMVRFGDGTNWNPGSGRGVYYYDSDQARWILMSSESFFLEIAKGNVTGHSIVNKFGRNSDVANGTQEDIWDGGGTYTWPSSASVTHARAETDSATTRSMVIEVQGLDTNWALTVQNVTLDGTDSTTEVALTTALRRVFRMKVLDADVADQAIWVGPTGFASKQGIITAGNNQTLMALYTVPAGKTAYLLREYSTINVASTSNLKGALVRRWAVDNTNGYAKQLKYTYGLALVGSSGHNRGYELFPSFAAKTDIYISAEGQSAAADISAGFDLLLIDD